LTNTNTKTLFSKAVWNRWTGLLDWNTGLDSDIQLVLIFCVLQSFSNYVQQQAWLVAFVCFLGALGMPAGLETH